MRYIILIGLVILLLVGCNTLDENCGKKYDIDDCNFAKCMYEGSEGYAPGYRAQLLNNYYECKDAN